MTHFALMGAALKDRETYEEFRASGETEFIPDDLKPIWTAIEEYYVHDTEAQSVDLALLEGFILGSERDAKRGAFIRETLERLAQVGTSATNARRAVNHVRRVRLGERLATELLGAGRPEELAQLIADYQKSSDAEEDDADEANAWTPESIIGGGPNAARVAIAPKALNRRLRGGLLPGHHLTILARPNLGKTAVALNMAVFAARKGHRALYLGNEDPSRDLMIRSLQLFTGMSYDDVMEQLPDAITAAEKQGAHRLLFRDLSPGSLMEIDRLVRKHAPRLLVVDQMRNVHAGKGENMTQRLDMVAQGLRNVAKRHNISVVSVTQAGDSARNKLVLDDGDVDSSNTGIPGACDVLLGVGANDMLVSAGQRCLTLCKNKVGARQEHFMVHLDPITLKLRSTED